MLQASGANGYVCISQLILYSVICVNMMAVPFAGGTSLEANFAAPYGGISIDFAFMDQIVEFHPDE